MRDNSLTILLTLKGRPAFTFRWLDYMNRVGCPYPIIISDGGDDPGVESALSKHRVYPELQYTYHRFPYDATSADYSRKLRDSLLMIDSEYMLFADNDDFLLMNRLAEAVGFLQRNPEYASCGSRTILLDCGPPQATDVNRRLSGGPVHLALGAQGFAVGGGTPLERILMALSDYFDFGFWYYVHRTRPVQEFACCLTEMPLEKYIFYEYLFSAFLAKHGNIKPDAAPFYLRQTNTSLGACNDGAGADNYFLMSVLPFWERDIAAFTSRVMDLAGVPGSGERQALDLKLREQLAVMLSATYRHTLVPAPGRLALADTLGLRSTRAWEMARSARNAINAWKRNLTPSNLLLFRRILAQNPEIALVLDFLKQKPDPWLDLASCDLSTTTRID